MLGVAFVTGSLVLNDTAQKLFDDQFATASAGADVTVRMPPSHEIVRRLMNPPRIAVAAAASAAVITVLLLLRSHPSYEFIYFQF